MARLSSPQNETTSSGPGPAAALAGRLLDRDLIDPVGLARAQRAAAETGAPLHRMLVRLGLVGERDMAGALAAVTGLPQIAADDFPETPLLEDRLGARFLRDALALPVADTGDGVRLAVADPLDRFPVQAATMALGRPVLPCVAIPAELEAALDRLYGGGQGTKSTEGHDGGHDADDETGADDIERLRDLASEAPVIRIVNTLIRRAVEARASDIHIEPFEGRLRVRYRVDGVLQEVEAPPAQLRAAVVSRVKIMAHLDIAERRLPQDGRSKMVVHGKPIDLRVVTLPTLHGEGVVLRLLDRDTVSLDFADLGLDPAMLDRYFDLLERPNGILLVTGPTGSGKTTTLYASLSRLNRPGVKIVTVEDPVEYQLRGITQIPVRPQIGLTFASILRSILRGDPDIIMIGEIRDLETAEIAVQAALTGHLMLATVHTNTASATVTRLLDMGLQDFLLTSTINGIVAQRLVRRLCPDCRRAHDVLPELARRAGLAAPAPGDVVRLYQPVGCARCGGSGYAGRIALTELLVMDDRLRRLVLQRADAGEIQKAAAEGGMRTMYEDGVAKALAGVTSLDEVLRVTRSV
ncbi:GspE/PulE family protein [Azospirillum canadense]|uniref:GspE/PulE family protein n=1 Tax=Azospirillum canadense TaxID=403962 RepID=UPI0022271822|nr:ATPase, T2SS/T4P/T4SS family [Azospirillum canadense]MCW2239560.1 general secretion pathway protein E [Azospirillum canadense]